MSKARKPSCVATAASFWVVLAGVSIDLAAQPSQRQAAAVQPVPPASEMPMDDYLGLLAQIAPAARDGARAFVDAHRQRCGRALATGELRVAMASGNGDPVLMAMIRASQLRDNAELTALAGRVTCRGAGR